MNLLTQALDNYNTAAQQKFTVQELANQALADAGYKNLAVQDNLYGVDNTVFLVLSSPYHIVDYPLTKEVIEILGRGLPEHEVCELLMKTRVRAAKAELDANVKKQLLKTKSAIVSDNYVNITHKRQFFTDGAGNEKE